MSLQTGGRLAETDRPVIDPGQLKVVAYVLRGPLLTKNPSLLRTADIREMGRLGMIIDSDDELIGVDEVIKIEKLYKLNFPLVGMAVVDDTRHKLGKVEDYTVDTDSFVIQQLSVRRGIFRGITETSLLVHRSQVLEINDKAIIVKSARKQRSEPIVESIREEFVNPFRKPAAQPEPEG
ncbi:PRC-barrel domain-containing protein [Candidatus Saccharibacteria bacterium]|nr:PRC-barrel domain-containing protein [Candidatus Saccharibacteria bacterium]